MSEGEIKKRIKETMLKAETDDIQAFAVLMVQDIDEAKKEIFEINCLVCQGKPLFKGLPCFEKAEKYEKFTRFCPWLMNVLIKQFGENKK